MPCRYVLSCLNRLWCHLISGHMNYLRRHPSDVWLWLLLLKMFVRLYPGCVCRAGQGAGHPFISVHPWLWSTFSQGTRAPPAFNTAHQSRPGAFFITVHLESARKSDWVRNPPWWHHYTVGLSPGPWRSLHFSRNKEYLTGISYVIFPSVTSFSRQYHSAIYE